MQATEILMSEHRVIERVLTSLEAAAHRLQQGKPVPPVFFLDAADFIKGFADGCHHKKEEDVLFTALTANGLPVQGGPVGVMLAEHEQGRVFAREMRAAAQSLAESPNPVDCSAAEEAIIRSALGYVTLLRQHIKKEDSILFPLADRTIPLAGQEKVAEDFERIEHEETGEGVHEKYLALAEKLEKEAAS